MLRVIEYDVVTAYAETDLYEAVNAKIEEGWQPFGSVAASQSAEGKLFAQAVVKYAPEAA